MPQPAASPRSAPKPLGPWMALALVVGSLIGSGIFLLPATLAPLGAAQLPGWLVAIGGSLAIILRRGAWLGAGALGVFTLLATVVAHGFWRFEGIERAHQFNTFLEHIGLIGGFLLAAILIDARRPLP